MFKKLFNLLALFFLTAYLISCASDVKIRSMNIKMTEGGAYLDLWNDTSSKASGIDSRWFEKLETSCRKNKIVYNYEVLEDSSNILIYLQFDELFKLRGFLYDIGLDDSEMAFPLHLECNYNEDSVSFSMKFMPGIFLRKNYILIETPSNNSSFYPNVKTNTIRSEKIASNKIYFYINRDDVTDTLEQSISLSFEKNTRLKENGNRNDKDSFLVDKKEVTLLGFKRSSWEFWCIIIGGVASIITIIAFFIKRRD